MGSATGNTVQGNLIGTDAAGTVGLGDGFGVRLNTPDNLVGGASAAARNVISGNATEGVDINAAAATGNRVTGNYIGTDVTGTQDLGNAQAGVRVVHPGHVADDEVAAHLVVGGGDLDRVRGAVEPVELQLRPLRDGAGGLAGL